MYWKVSVKRIRDNNLFIYKKTFKEPFERNKIYEFINTWMIRSVLSPNKKDYNSYG